jgi:hypothetical protein
LLQFSPKISGEAYWLNKNTIEFRPESNLPSGKKYRAKFNVGKVKDVEADLSVFEFDFKILEQSIFVEIESFSPYQNNKLDNYSIKGKLRAADVINLGEFRILGKCKAKG